ncbi:MAG: hypothetical protein HY355_05345 [Armatimonadetes bacterium]|nr:hypothetical protein [Armatimonadota bacterium]
MTTEEIMAIALEMGGLAEVPEDSGIWVRGDNLRRVLVGIDAGPAELKIARDLGFDALIAHHPVRRAGFWKVFERHYVLMGEAGVPEHAITAAIAERREAIRLSEMNANDDHTVSVARLLGMPFMNVHLPLDIYCRAEIQRAIRELQAATPRATVAEVAAYIGRLSSFQASELRPQVVYGSPHAPAGKVAVSISGGTNGGYPVLAAYFAYGVDTVVYMHIGAEDVARLQADDVRGAAIITGHAPGDSIGIDELVRRLRQRGLEVETFSGIFAPSE